MYRNTDIRNATCTNCGAAIVTFRNEVDLAWQIDATQLPITEDIAALKAAGRTVWVWNPPSEAWIPKFGHDRDWRDHRAGHQCPTHQP